MFYSKFFVMFDVRCILKLVKVNYTVQETQQIKLNINSIICES